MKNTINNNEQQDAFNEIFKQKLENQQLPVDAECWEAIEKRLHPSNRRKNVWWLWMPIGSAALVAFIFSLLPLLESKHTALNAPLNKVATQVIHVEKAIASAPRAKDFISSKVQTHFLSKGQLVAVNNSCIEPVLDKKSVLNELVEIKTNNPDTLLFENNPTDVLTTELVNQLAISQSADSVEGLRSKETSLPNLNTPIDWTAPKNKNRDNWLLAASFGSAGSSSLKGDNTPLTFRESSSLLSEDKPKFAARQLVNEFSNTNYNTPLSFGLSIGKNLNNSLSVETGLMYTYLLTTFENVVEQRKDAKLHLHYIGLPINLIVRLWQNNKWNAYVSGGVLVEKGLQSLYVENRYYGNSVYTTTATEKIDGLQASVNASVGVTYKLQPSVGIYFEPKFSYFFDNDQPVSARTNQAVSLGLVAGLRINL